MDSAGGTSNVSTEQFGTSPDFAQHFNVPAALSRYHTGTSIDVAAGVVDRVREGIAKARGQAVSHGDILENAKSVASSGSFNG